MTKKLLKKPSMQEIMQSSTVGNKSIDPKYAYINGYYKAADHLVDTALKITNRIDKDSLIYPICFNYRHYIELHLKSLIEEAENLYDKMDELGYLQNEKLPKKNTNSLKSIHSLYELLTLFKNVFLYISISNEELPKDIEKYIKQMHDADKNGQKYRYHKNKNDELHFPNEDSYDIKNMSQIMKEVNTMLWAINHHIDYYIDMSNNIISDYKNYM